MSKEEMPQAILTDALVARLVDFPSAQLYANLNKEGIPHLQFKIPCESPLQAETLAQYLQGGRVQGCHWLAYSSREIEQMLTKLLPHLKYKGQLAKSFIKLAQVVMALASESGGEGGSGLRRDQIASLIARIKVEAREAKAAVKAASELPEDADQLNEEVRKQSFEWLRIAHTEKAKREREAWGGYVYVPSEFCYEYWPTDEIYPPGDERSAFYPEWLEIVDRERAKWVQEMKEQYGGTHIEQFMKGETDADGNEIS